MKSAKKIRVVPKKGKGKGEMVSLDSKLVSWCGCDVSGVFTIDPAGARGQSPDVLFRVSARHICL